MGARLSRGVVAALGVALGVGTVLLPAPAQAAARVSITSAGGGAVVDPTHLTTLTISGRGFQSVRGGFGGIYVFFGTVRDGWQPSRGGVTGTDLSYVPDSEAKDNAGYQKFVAFPGSDTEDSANGGTISAAGSWTTTINVPGAVFRTTGRDGEVTTVDCREVTCGVITIGAHGVASSRNETFTPVRVADLATRPTASSFAGVAPTSAPTTSTAPATVGTSELPATPVEAGPVDTGTGTGTATSETPTAPVLEVDRASARAGHVLAFSATGLSAGSQVSAVLDDGVAAAGPFVVGSSGQLAGVITLPTDAAGGTHELRLHGVDSPPSVRFPIAEAGPGAGVSGDGTTDLRTASTAGTDRTAVLFVVAAAAVFLVALGRLASQLIRRQRVPRAP